MKINLTDLQHNINKFKGFLDNFEENSIQETNVLNSIPESWKDSRLVSFRAEIEKNNINNEKELLNLQELLIIYNYIYNSYSAYAKTSIEIELGSQDTISAKIDNIIDIMDKIINKLNNLDTSFCPYERNHINKEKRKLKNIKRNTSVIKTKIIDTMNEIEDIEQGIEKKVNNVDKLVIDVFDREKI